MKNIDTQPGFLNDGNGAALLSVAPHNTFADEIRTVERKPEPSEWEDDYPIISLHWGELRYG